MPATSLQAPRFRRRYFNRNQAIMHAMRHARFVAIVLALSTGLMAGGASDEGPSEQLTAVQWSQAIWKQALHGDLEGLNERFHALPAELAGRAQGERFASAVQQHQANLERARQKRDEDRTAALAELRKHVDANDLPKALRAAVTVQTLGDRFEAALDDPDVQHIVGWAQEQLPKVEADNDWLMAQELLFLLRTLYDETDRLEEFQKYDRLLNAVNRRVSLLAQYAPRRLHELRVAKAQRLAEPPVPEFRERQGEEWREKIEKINAPMMREALRKAASDHIEAKGWRPLLQGGLEELRLLATTASLDETFPNLGNADLVKQWVAHIDNELATLAAAPDERLSAATLSRMLDDLVRVNERTAAIQKEVLYREFGDGAMYELDQFSEIIWPDKLPRFRQATEGAFVGVGILIRHNDTQEIVVVNPLEGSPAYFGGVKPDDIIAEVDGESTVGWSLNDAVDRITGAPATSVTLGLQRKDQEGVLPITLKRDIIKLRSVMGWWKRSLLPDGSPQWDWLVDPDSRIAYVRLTQFTDDTYPDLLKAWREITAVTKPTGLILDLRYNPGGLLSSAVDVSNLFIRQGVIVSGEDKDGVKVWRDQKAKPEKAWDLDGVAVAVLINQGSASASEIVAGCLQAHGAAVVVGERSFGKGSVQTVHQPTIDARLKLTTQYYRLPQTPEQRENNELGRLVHKRPGAQVWGVDPDIVVKMTPDQNKAALELRQAGDVIGPGAKADPKIEAGRPDIRRLLTEGLDPQLERALLILQAHALGMVDSSPVRRASRN